MAPCTHITLLQTQLCMVEEDLIYWRAWPESLVATYHGVVQRAGRGGWLTLQKASIGPNSKLSKKALRNLHAAQEAQGLMSQDSLSAS